MSSTALNTTQELIERSFYERIRLELVSKGYLPDISTYPDTDIGYANYKAAIDAVVTAKGFCIDLFGAGNAESRGTLKTPRIVIDTISSLPGAIGGDTTYIHREDDGDPYTVSLLPPQTVDFILHVTLVGSTIEEMRIMNSIIALALPRRGYIEFYNDNTEKFFIENTGSNDRQLSRDNQSQRTIAYTVLDLYDIEERVIETNIPPIDEITIETEVNENEDETTIIT